MKIRHLSYEQELDFFDQYEKLVYYCLAQLNKKPHHDDFDDLAQLARLELVQIYEHFDYPEEKADFSFRLVAYAKNKIRWRIIDELRKKQRRKENEFCHDPHSPMPLQADCQWKHLHYDLSLASYQKHLTDRESHFLHLRCEHDLTMAEIGKIMSLSCQSLYRLRKSLAVKLKELKADLKN